MTGQIVEGMAVTEDGKNVFHEISSLQALVCTYAGFNTMCWENPDGAGVLKTENLNAAANSFIERATDILWTRIYSHMFEVIAVRNKAWTEEQVRHEIAVLVSGMDLWS